MKNSRFLYLAALILALVSLASAKKESGNIVMLWPNDTQPTLRLTFANFQYLGGYGGQKSYAAEVTAENLSDKPIPRASFTVYLFDKARVRIGEGNLNLNDVPVHQPVRVQFQFFSVGAPATLQLTARNTPSGIPTSLKTVPVKVVSVPPGAKLQVDGKEAGITPVTLNFAMGTHALELSKIGYATANTPLDVTADEAPGGSITVELGGLSADTIEMRDGSVLLGDVMSMSLTSLVVRVNGQNQDIDRNREANIAG